MNIRGRLARLERQQPPPRPGEPETVIWMPRKDDGSGPPPGDYLSPDGRVLTRIYVAELLDD